MGRRRSIHLCGGLRVTASVASAAAMETPPATAPGSGGDEGRKPHPSRHRHALPLVAHRRVVGWVSGRERIETASFRRRFLEVVRLRPAAGCFLCTPVFFLRRPSVPET